jgi:hypothetical protein
LIANFSKTLCELAGGELHPFLERLDRGVLDREGGVEAVLHREQRRGEALDAEAVGLGDVLARAAPDVLGFRLGAQPVLARLLEVGGDVGEALLELGQARVAARLLPGAGRPPAAGPAKPERSGSLTGKTPEKQAFNWKWGLPHGIQGFWGQTPNRGFGVRPTKTSSSRTKSSW